MANKRITELTDIGTPASADVLEIVDVSDTTDSPEGTSKKVQVSALGGAVDSVNSQTGVVSIDLESVLTEGDEAISTDGLTKIVLDKETGKLEVYKRNDIGDAFVLQSFYGKDSEFTYGNRIKFLGDTDTAELYLSSTNGVYFKDLQVGGLGNYLKTNGFLITEDADVIGIPNFVQVEVEHPISQGGQIILPAVDSDAPTYVSLNKIMTGSFPALNGIRYTANGTLTVTDPTPVTNKGYIVHVIGGSVTIGGVAYTNGALVYRYYDGSSWISTNMNSDTTATTGSVISFATPQVYNSIASPSTSNITDDLTNAKIGIVQEIYHNHSVTPTFPAGWVRRGDGEYVVSVLNIIFAKWSTGTTVEYWITQ